MGQYYNPVLLKETEDKPRTWFYAWDFSNGLKLMEHSYLSNNFVGTVCNQLVNKAQRVVWAGDYADEEKGTEGQGYEGQGLNIYSLCENVPKSRARISYDNKKYPIIINHTTKEFVDTSKIKPDADGWEIHPLPLLTVEGNGRGGGDYNGADDYVGLWARHLIEIKSVAPKEYEEIHPDFTEH